jgi:type II secretory pathway pseudopilin PulG
VNSIRTAIVRRLHSTDEGISLVEVMIAMIIFSIVSLGVIGSLIATAGLAIDSRARETATNLASQAIDAAMATPDVFDLFDAPNVVTTVDGHTYTVNRVARWVSDPNSVAPCGAGGGALLYKRVNVTVTWPGMANPSSPVQEDTLISPNDRVSDPDDATILVSASDQSAKGVSGVTVTTTPALNPPADVTDVDGCTYLLKVPVGTYAITVSKVGYISPTVPGGTPAQQTSQTLSFTVVSGASVSAPFTMDTAQPLGITYASSAPGAARPTSMYTSLVHGTDAAIDANALPTPLALYPYAPDGYSVYAGHFVPKITGNNGCQDANPQLWVSSKVSGVTYTSPATPPVVPAAGATVNVPMGLVTVKGTAASQPISAVQQAGTTPDPGCSLSNTYNFGSILSSGKATTLALPFGTYKLFYSTNGTGTAVAAANITVTVPSTISSNQVVLDPRVAG